MDDINVKFVVKICLLGEANVGKTSLVYRFIDDKFQKDYKATLGVSLLRNKVIIGGFGGVSVQIWDLGGQESFKTLRQMYLRGAQGALILYDITKRESFTKVDEWIQSFREDRKEEPLILIGNKNDLIKKAKVKENEAWALAGKNDMDLILTSAKTGDHVEEAFVRLIKSIVDRLT